MTRSIIAPLLLLAFTAPALAGPAKNPNAQRVIDHWTPERRAAATPRDFVLDAHGNAYLRAKDGALVAYGHSNGQLRATNPQPQPMAPPSGGSGDSTPPSISGMQPGAGATVGASVAFSATVTDASGIRSVSFVIIYPSGQTQSFSPSFVGNNTWQTSLSGFTNGNWKWRVVAKDAAKGGGNTATSADVSFTVDTGGGGGGGGGSHVTTNSPYAGGGAVQTAAGRIYFEMPASRRRTRWDGYVCSGTVATDGATGRATIVTAAHCVYDDANKAYARNVLFIPNQDGTSGAGTDLNCANDPIGCWAPAFGVVDINWTTRTFPDNVAWDYAFYVVSDTGAHSGSAASSDALAAAAGSMGLSFATPYTDDGDASASSLDFTHALGYSYSDDPNFMFCAEDMTSESAVNWWLPSCGLSGGASGGPWVQPLANGDGPIISVNSWGYTTAPGMAGPKFSGSSAACLFTEAQGRAFSSIPATDGDEGAAISCS